jgi:hypothetical protein
VGSSLFLRMFLGRRIPPAPADTGPRQRHGEDYTADTNAMRSWPIGALASCPEEAGADDRRKIVPASAIEKEESK